MLINMDIEILINNWVDYIRKNYDSVYTQEKLAIFCGNSPQNFSHKKKRRSFKPEMLENITKAISKKIKRDITTGQFIDGPDKLEPQKHFEDEKRFIVRRQEDGDDYHRFGIMKVVCKLEGQELKALNGIVENYMEGIKREKKIDEIA